jgi:hypothetical protein
MARNIFSISQMGISWNFIALLFYEISMFEVARVCNQCGCAPFKFDLVFLTPWAT